MAGLLRLHEDIRARLRRGMPRSQVHEQLAARYPAQKLQRALREYPEPGRFARYRSLNLALTVLLVLAFAAKILALAMLLPHALAAGVPPILLLAAPLPTAMLFAFAFYGIRDGMGLSYRAAMFMGMWTFLQLFLDDAAAPMPYVALDLAFAALLFGLAAFLTSRTLEPWTYPRAA